MQKETRGVVAHGASRLPAVIVDSYNAEVKDDDGFVGDRASRGAFRELLDHGRKVLRKSGDDDPLGGKDSEEIGKKKLDELLLKGEPEAAAVVHGAVEEFAQEFAAVIKRFQKLKSWKDTERIAVGGGFRDSRAGELAIGRTAVLLKAEKVNIDLVPIHHDPDEAGLIGTVHLAPHWIFEGREGFLAVDIGGSNIRAGIVELNLRSGANLSKAKVWRFDLWCHAEEKKLSRDDAVGKLVSMLEKLIEKAQKEKFALAPFIGVGCPGIITDGGSIERGAQNLPGRWDSKSFNLPQALATAVPKIGDHDTAIVMHNDAVIQGLSELPFMNDVKRWGVLTIGTGLGNAQFSNRQID